MRAKGSMMKDVGSMMKDVFRSLGLATQMGAMVVTSILACLFLGLWIDGKLHSYPWATLIFIAVGTLVATVGAYRVVSPVIEEVAVEQRVEMPTKEILRSLALVARLALMAVGPVLIGLFLGLLIDVMLYTRPWVTLLLTAVGISVGLVGVYRFSSSIMK
jgi:F0F1-type ATP synthase assembly protein I